MYIIICGFFVLGNNLLNRLKHLKMIYTAYDYKNIKNLTPVQENYLQYRKELKFQWSNKSWILMIGT